MYGPEGHMQLNLLNKLNLMDGCVEVTRKTPSVISNLQTNEG